MELLSISLKFTMSSLPLYDHKKFKKSPDQVAQLVGAPSYTRGVHRCRQHAAQDGYQCSPT